MTIGKPCGYGQYIWKNGSTYMGEFRNGLKHGFGKYRKSKELSTNMYEGQYFKDKKQGFGVFKWASGNLYIGQYEADEREGIGKMCWTDGSVYIGQWERGIQNGYGVMTFPDGTVKQGLFENNIYQGPSDPPQPLDNPGFDVMRLVPPGVSFSEEILSLRTSVRPHRSHYNSEFFPGNRSKSERRSGKPPLQPSMNDRSATRDLKSVHTDFKSKKRGDSAMRGIHLRMTSYRDGSKESSVPLKRVKMASNRTLYAPSGGDSSLVQLRVRKVGSKKVWKPSGVVHYNNTMNFAKRYYLLSLIHISEPTRPY
eukprot:TRINITY_DN5316_c0_g2_i1.p1 TRINITY_DN5316_c0_g2~~TRINITY_DN5316_c0_g2_i1.p1  ORF type:complete len:310 (+),score=47.77 TRINITY_DN5316_c0_g2_i1:435-1364(+)